MLATGHDAIVVGIGSSLDQQKQIQTLPSLTNRL